MNRRDWQNAFGEAPEDFRLRLRETLDGLEEKDMKKRYKVSTVLIAAVLLIAVLAGAGIAASRLGVFRLLDSAEPIVPLPGAQELVGTNLGMSENEYAVLTVEEAVFDGQGVLVQCRLTPRDTGKYAMLNAFMQNTPEETYIREIAPVQMAQGSQEVETGAGMQTIINDGEKQQLLINGVEVEIPSSREEAHKQGLIVYRMDGEIYYADYEEYRVLGRRDGRETIGYWVNIAVGDDLIFMNTADAQEQEDGSIVWWASGVADEVLDADEIELRVSARLYEKDEYGADLPALEEIAFTLPKSEAERKYIFTPAGNAFGERFEILSGSIVCTRVRGYLKIDYRYWQAESGEEMGIDFRIYDANGQRINTGSGGTYEENGVHHCNMEMQSFEDIPETIYLEAKVIGEDKTLGRVECRVVEE